MAGEEVVGGIVGFLRLDADEFHREITRAIAEVKVLKGMDAKVDVRVTGARKAEAEMLKVGAAAKAAERNVGGMGQSMGRLGTPQLIVGGIAAGMALLGPVTGAATAAMAGFVGVAGTAALAYVGFKEEIEKGTALGREMQSQIDGLGGAFKALGSTAAGAMSADVIGGMRDLRDFLPSLNDEVGLLATHLGKAFRTSVVGLTSGLSNMMPLLQDGGRYAEDLARKFANFSQSQDFKDFVAYAREKLPEVVAAVSSLAGGIKDLGVALAPVGDDLIKIIDVTGKVASGLGWVLSAIEKVNNATQIPGLDPYAEKMDKAAESSKKAATATDTTAVKMMSLASIQTPLATGLGTTDQALQRVSEKQRTTADTTTDAMVAMQLQNDAAGILKQTLDTLNGKTLSAAEAQNSFDSSLANMGTHVTTTGKKVKFTTSSIFGMSAASVALRGQLNGQVGNLQRVVEAQGGLTNMTGKSRAEMVKMRQQIIDNAVAHGVDKKAVTAYVDSIFKIPKTVPPTKLEVEKKRAMDDLRAFQKAIDNLHGKVVVAGVRYVRSGEEQTSKGSGRSTAGGQTFAGGGTIRGIPGYAGGTLVGPGTGKSDSILAGIAGTSELIRVSNGEFISTDASRRRNAAALEAGNKGATLVAAGSGQGATTVTETTHAPVIIQALYASDTADIRRKAELARWQGSVKGRG